MFKNTSFEVGKVKKVWKFFLKIFLSIKCPGTEFKRAPFQMWITYSSPIHHARAVSNHLFKYIFNFSSVVQIWTVSSATQLKFMVQG